MFQNVSDEAISAGDSASFIISQMIAFGIEAKDAQLIIDKVNETANQFSVSSGDLATALGIVASTSSAMGNSIDQTLGVVTAITEQTRNASKSARAANTIFSRLAQVVDENSDTGKKLTEIYNNLGIALYDSSGQMRSTYDILADLASKWDSLDKNTQQYIAITSAGTNQLNNFLALMNNFDHAAEATATSLNSAGSAMRENEAYQESLEYQTNNLKATFQDLANNVIDKQLISALLTLGDAFLKVANTGLGTFIAKVGLLAGTGWGLTSLAKVSKLIPTITRQFSDFGAVLSLVAEGSGTFGAAISAAGGFASVSLPILLAVGAAIVGIYEGVKAYNEYVESHKYENLVAHFEELNEQVKKTADNLEEAQKKLDALEKTPTVDRGEEWRKEREELQQTIDAYEYLLELRKGEAEDAAKEAYSADVTTSVSYSGSISDKGTINISQYGGTSVHAIKLTQEQLEALTADYDNVEDAVRANISAFDEYIDEMSKTKIAELIESGDTIGAYKKMEDALRYIGIRFQEVTASAEEYTAAQSRNMSVLSSEISIAVSNGEKITQLQQDEYEGYIKASQGRYEYIKGLDEASDGQKAFAANYETMVRNFVKYNLSNELMDTTDAVTYLTNVLPGGAQAALEFAQAYGLIGKDVTFDSLGLVELADGALALKESCYQATDGLYYLKDGCDALAGSGDEVADAMSQIEVATYDASTYTAQLTSSLFDLNGQLTEAGATALQGSSGLQKMATAELQAQQTAANANFNKLVLEIQKVGSAALITAGQLSQMMALAGVGSAQGLVGGLASGASTDIEGLKSAFFRAFGKSADANVADFNKWVSSRVYSAGQSTYDRIMEETQKRIDELEKNFPSGGGGGSSRKSAEEKAAEEAEKQAKKAQKAQEKAAKESQEAYESAAKSAEQAAQQAAQAAEQAAEEAKQKILDSISELKDASDDFWESKTDAIEETNKELDRQKQLEEKLKALEEAKQRKILLYKNGQFQYDKDYGTIAKAQADYEETRDKIQRERELEQLQEMKDNATEIFNEMKDIVQNGGNVTQEMINNWLSQMQADGANYYESNKQMLNEWLDWARGAITEFGQGVVEAVSGTSAISGGAYGSNAQSQVATDTNGARYLNDPLYWKNGEFVGFSVAWWIDRFQEQIQRGNFGDYTKSADWLGQNPGTSVFDDWNKVLEYWAKYVGKSGVEGEVTDPYALQDMLDRVEAAKIVLDKYQWMFESLNYDEYAKIAEKIKNLDVNKAYSNALIQGAIAHADDPFGWRTISPADWTTVEGKLYDILNDIASYESLTGSRDAKKEDQRGSDYKRLTIAGDLKRTAQLGGYHRADEKLFTDAWGDYYPGVEYVKFDEDKLRRFYEDNESAIKQLQEMWFEARTETEKQAIHLEAEARRQARDYAEEILGMEPSGKSEAERAANESKVTNLREKKKQQLDEKNAKDIEDRLDKIVEGSNISQKYIDNVREYIGGLIEDNSKKWFDIYDQTEKDKLHDQNEYYRQLLEKLEQAEEVGNVTGGDMNPWEEEIETIDDWVAEQVEALRAQMAENSAAWWKTEDKAERDALHEANVELAKQIEQLLGNGVQMKYEGHTGRWSWEGPGNASGTHNFIPMGKDENIDPWFSGGGKGGINSATAGLSLVGENGPELRVLRRGDNIIPADKTANLWKWASLTPSSMLGAIGNRSAKVGNVSYGFNISNLQLPNVTDAKSLVQGLKNYALQYNYKR